MSYQNEIIKVNSNLLLLAPKMQELVSKAVTECNEAGYTIEVFEAWRSPERQSQLYAQGRTTPGKTVTNSYSWYSFHQYGLAVDVAYRIDGKWSWADTLDWDKPSKIFQNYGFDKPPVFEKAHFQISGGLHVAEARKITQSSGLQALWVSLDLV